MSKEWNKAWVESVGTQVSVVLDDQRVVDGVVTKVYSTVPQMRVKGDDDRVHYTHPRYARPIWR